MINHCEKKILKEILKFTHKKESPYSTHTTFSTLRAAAATRATIIIRRHQSSKISADFPTPTPPSSSWKDIISGRFLTTGLRVERIMI